MGEERVGSRVAGQAAVIFALSLSARWIYVRQASDHPLWDVPVGAAIGYVGRSAAADGGAGFASLYDVLLAGTVDFGGEVGGMAGINYALVRGIQVLLGACNGVMVWSLALTAFSSRVAVAAGLAAALYGPSIYFSGELTPTVLATSLILISLISLSRALASAEAGSFWLPGFLLGLAVLASWWVSLFALAAVFWLLRQEDRGVGAAGRLVIGIAVLLLPAFLWSAWTPGAVEIGLSESFRRVYALWQGGEFLPDLDPYYALQHSSMLSVLLWDAGLAFPFGLAAPLALMGMVLRLRAERESMESCLLLFAGCFAVQGLLFSSVDSAVRATAVPVLLIFAAVGVGALYGLPRRQGLAAGAACFVLAVGLNMGHEGGAGRARQHHWLGYGFEQLGLRANAVREYETALSLDAENKDTYYALSEHYLDQGDNIRAAGLYESLVQRWPDERQARRALADQYMAAGRAPETVQLYLDLIGAQADSATAHLLPMLGEALVLSGDAEGGIRAYQEALEFLPGNIEARERLALLYASTGRLPQALEASRILFEAGSVAEFGPLLAEVLIHTERDEEAADVLEQVLQEESESTAALALRGKQLFEQGRHREAVVYFERLRPLSPEDYRVHFFLSKIYEQLGEQAEADSAHAVYFRYRRQKDLEEVQGQAKLMREKVLDDLRSQLEGR